MMCHGSSVQVVARLIINILCVAILTEFQQFEVNPTIFKYDELHAATNGFHPEMKLGEGGYGVVYKVNALLSIQSSSLPPLTNVEYIDEFDQRNQVIVVFWNDL